MLRVTISFFYILVFSIISFNLAAKAQNPERSKDSNKVYVSKFQEYIFYNCENEFALLDGYALELQSQQQQFAYVIVYGSDFVLSEEIEHRIMFIRKYLIKKRFINPDRLIVIHGGYRRKLSVELWVISSLDKVPLSTPATNIKKNRSKSPEVKYYDCSELY